MGFFDNLSKKATETYKSTTEKTNKIARELKLKSAISERKDKIKGIYAEIGKKVYEKHIREENIDINADLANECAKIDAFAKEIEDMNTEMLSLRNMRVCKNCNSEISFSSRFCPKCGAEQEIITIKTEVQVGETEGGNNEVEVTECIDNSKVESYISEETDETQVKTDISEEKCNKQVETNTSKEDCKIQEEADIKEENGNTQEETDITEKD